MCCSVGFARSLGLALLPLALSCILANLLLLFPMGEITYIQQNRLASYIWYFGGLGGGGLLVSKKLHLLWTMFCYIKFMNGAFKPQINDMFLLLQTP